MQCISAEPEPAKTALSIVQGQEIEMELDRDSTTRQRQYKQNDVLVTSRFQVAGEGRGTEEELGRTDASRLIVHACKDCRKQDPRRI